MAEKPKDGFTRRDLVRGTLVGAIASGVGTKAPVAGSPLGPGPAPLALKINGAMHHLSIEPRVTLADALRDRIGLTGTKIACGRGACGACTVLLDGETVCSCLMLAHEASGRSITTIEGIAVGGRLTPLQEAFIEVDALQCGFCTSGMVVSCQRLLDRNPKPTRHEIREAVAGNLCRCGTYNHVFDAVERAAGTTKAAADEPALVAHSRLMTPDSRLLDDSRVAQATLDAMEEEGLT